MRDDLNTMIHWSATMAQCPSLDAALDSSSDDTYQVSCADCRDAHKALWRKLNMDIL